MNVRKLVERPTAVLAVFATFAGLPAAGLAHGNERHVMGTVRTIQDDRVVVETTHGTAVSVEVTAKTRFADEKNTPAERSDLRPGDRVVVDLPSSGESRVADEIRFSHPGARSTGGGEGEK